MICILIRKLVLMYRDSSKELFKFKALIRFSAFGHYVVPREKTGGNKENRKNLDGV